ncbi:ribosome recycling factor [Hydrogenibacillus schlegelii]|uniref:Ribosome-recycling factor n=1 Tax=Hydrogenibacillus schlegelii TaxID=1484 RepID=A0A132MHF3_HYDSH|nr:ribosome recycling factor [Hydrogenibacillus schlegelii]KWW96841.1 ribosome recycling factor [Hydrogenibacillus schlegelii]MBT9281427.1 ribosome recycling factor [Hydrogenibacillus schlegelii]OAR04725.1 ribosome recycling factor [Hydrogenibacillus schlegelii]
MSHPAIEEARNKMEKAVSVLKGELVSVRAGRANPAMLEKVTVSYYGADVPLNQVATITAPEPRLLVITPWDGSVLGEIERAIQKSDLGLNPTNDGKVVRIVLPPLTEERRRELVKLVKKYGEEAKVAIRNVRRDALEVLKKAEKDGELPEDTARRLQDELQKTTDAYVKKVDEIVEAKEAEILEI